MRDPDTTRNDREIAKAVALRMLRENGLASLSVRKIAAELGTSYQLIYTLFGDKIGLLNALISDGFEQLGSVCAKASAETNSAQSVLAVVFAYRDFALQNANLYELMFSDPVAIPRAKATRAKGVECFQALLMPVERYWKANTRTKGRFIDPQALAIAIWTSTHGHVQFSAKSWFQFEFDDRKNLEGAVMALLDSAG